jgi:hypothetical protein
MKALLLLAAVFAGAQAQSIFQVVTTPNLRPSPSQNGLNAAAASSASDIWAVGQSTIHFNGTEWTAYPAPDILGNNLSLLWAVVDFSPTDAWAIGNAGTITESESQVIEHWNGTAWSLFPGPIFASGDTGSLYAMAATSADNIWALGALNLDGDGVEAVFEHWNGSAWTATTNVSLPWAFESASADAPNDIWAVGEGPFSVHYDGTSWTSVSTPRVGNGPSMLHGVAALAPDNVWAVGYSSASDEAPMETLIEHYDGTSWSVVPSPNVGPNSKYQSNKLWGVTAVSANDIWAYGEYLAASGSGDQSTLLLHWNGTSWSLAACPDPITGSGTVQGDILWGGVVTGPGSVWIVGAEDVGIETLVLHTTGG